MNAYKSFNDLMNEVAQNGSASFIWCGYKYDLVRPLFSDKPYIKHGDNQSSKGYIATVDQWDNEKMNVFTFLFSSLVQSTIRIEDVFKPLNQ